VACEVICDVVDLSPNFNAAAVLGRTVVVHATRSGTSMNPLEYIGTRNYMRQPGNPSSHLVIGRASNQIARVVPDNLQAWHAQEDNDNTWGIELCQGVELDGFTDDQMAQLVVAGKHYMQAFGVPPVRVFSSSEPGFVGHEDTAQGRRNGKSDPGALFDWNWFIAALQEDDLSAEDKAKIERERLRRLVKRTLDRDGYEFVVDGQDAVTGEWIVNVLSGFDTDEPLRIRLR
jgi:N-acetyl-anhydromuramyl-L-alanine amidase AmpD